MSDAVQSPACNLFRGEILKYFRRPEGGAALNAAARKHYEECVDCVISVVTDAFEADAEEFESMKLDSPELRDLKQVFTEWGMATTPPTA